MEFRRQCEVEAESLWGQCWDLNPCSAVGCTPASEPYHYLLSTTDEKLFQVYLKGTVRTKIDGILSDLTLSLLNGLSIDFSICANHGPRYPFEYFESWPASFLPPCQNNILAAKNGHESSVLLENKSLTWSWKVWLHIFWPWGKLEIDQQWRPSIWPWLLRLFEAVVTTHQKDNNGPICTKRKPNQLKIYNILCGQCP